MLTKLYLLAHQVSKHRSIVLITPFHKKFCESISLYDKFKDFKNFALEDLNIDGITIVNSKNQAEKALKILKTLDDRIHAWDTETIDIEVKVENPIGKGKIICASAFCGPDVDFGNGPRLFIDNFGINRDLILIFKEYFESQKYKKCWHNYGFDRHILYNHGIDARGFGGDTMHMARLLDPSRGPKAYSLSRITSFYERETQQTKNAIIEHLQKHLPENDPRHKTLQKYCKLYLNTNIKQNMGKLFGRNKILKNGQPGKTFEIPSIVEMHTQADMIEKWVNYSALDAEVTFFLRETLAALLSELTTNFEDMNNMLDIYNKYWIPFGETLTDMERIGIKVDLEYLKNIQKMAEEDMKSLEAKFLDWVKETQKDAEHFNPSSTQQLQQLLFAPFERIKKQKTTITNFDDPIENLEYFAEEGVEDNSQINEDEEDEKPKRKINRTEPDSFPPERAFIVPNNKNEILPGKKAPLKNREMIITGLSIPPIDYTESGLPSVDTQVLKALAGHPPSKKYGKAYDYFKKEKNNEEFGIKVCEALHTLIEYRAIETLLNTFIIPIQEQTDSNGRVHCSLNINTETGRLSARKPNLQNQPALEKDKYKIRKAFIPEKGKKFIVADYGQLELRLLAHMTNCKNMIDAFHSGGDFHSRTAMGMYKEIKAAVDKGEVLLEWDFKKGDPPVPLLKDKYGAERRKAKTMNFSIAYGKSAHGFSKDWNCSMAEAQEALDAWYADRKEVKEWQDNVKKIAIEKGWTQTLIGRYRNLTKHFKIKNKAMVGHGLRAAINTPIQGGAADLVVAAMIKLHYNKELRDLGWKLLLQIHDEVILEGPEESAEQALELVKQLMIHPFRDPLRVALEVSSEICDNWYEAKQNMELKLIYMAFLISGEPIVS